MFTLLNILASFVPAVIAQTDFERNAQWNAAEVSAILKDENVLKKVDSACASGIKAIQVDKDGGSILCDFNQSVSVKVISRWEKDKSRYLVDKIEVIDFQN